MIYTPLMKSDYYRNSIYDLVEKSKSTAKWYFSLDISAVSLYSFYKVIPYYISI